MNTKAFILIGRSGSGKGTQADLLSDYIRKNHSTPVLYVQSGQEFRNFMTGPSYTASLSRTVNEVGGLQPEFLAVYMWTNILLREYTGSEYLIFDGVPRKVHEAGVLQSIFEFYKLGKPTVLYLNVRPEWAKQHLLVRGRHDDIETDIDNRFAWFDKEVIPTIELFRKSPDCDFFEIQAEVSAEEVHREIVKKVFQ